MTDEEIAGLRKKLEEALTGRHYLAGVFGGTECSCIETWQGPDKPPAPFDPSCERHGVLALIALADEVPSLLDELDRLRKVEAAAREYRIFQRCDPQTEYERVNRDASVNKARIALDAALTPTPRPSAAPPAP